MKGMMNLNNELLNYRLEHKLSQKQMADLLHVKTGAYFKYEHAINEMPYSILCLFLLIRKNEEDIIASNVLEHFIKKTI